MKSANPFGAPAGSMPGSPAAQTPLFSTPTAQKTSPFASTTPTASQTPLFSSATTFMGGQPNGQTPLFQTSTPGQQPKTASLFAPRTPAVGQTSLFQTSTPAGQTSLFQTPGNGAQQPKVNPFAMPTPVGGQTSLFQTPAKTNPFAVPTPAGGQTSLFQTPGNGAQQPKANPFAMPTPGGQTSLFQTTQKSFFQTTPAGGQTSLFQTPGSGVGVGVTTTLGGPFAAAKTPSQNPFVPVSSPAGTNAFNSQLQSSATVSQFEVATCPSGHGLQLHVAGAGHCDGCKRLVSEGEYVANCQHCNWYLCDACGKVSEARQRLAPPSNSTVKETPAPVATEPTVRSSVVVAHPVRPPKPTPPTPVRTSESAPATHVRPRARPIQAPRSSGTAKVQPRKWKRPEVGTTSRVVATSQNGTKSGFHLDAPPSA